MITCLLQMIPKVCVDCIPKAKFTQIGLQKKNRKQRYVRHTALDKWGITVLAKLSKNLYKCSTFCYNVLQVLSLKGISFSQMTGYDFLVYLYYSLIIGQIVICNLRKITGVWMGCLRIYKSISTRRDCLEELNMIYWDIKIHVFGD